ncbi:MAG TPA: four-carbon acid sugar kinase family protein [Opitutaceae bacterium]|nr:four-carbon acid sugar kinase family protein [Opitutaceae bacterium]
MTQRPLIVLADDLTGAAEIAAIAHQAGLRAVVHTTLPSGKTKADVIVCDTNTRLVRPSRAARIVADFAAQLKQRPHAAFFKKTDSVLRGHVFAEVTACARALGKSRTLLVPSNPSLGRVIRDGRYYIGGQPLHRTAFARDPIHPRETSDVRALLGGGDDPSLVCLPRTGRMPEAGLIIGEADTPADVPFWAGHVDEQTLPAGGADFFRAWLQSRRAYRPRIESAPLPEGGTLLLSGTATPPDPISPLPCPVEELSLRRLPTAAALATRLQPVLAQTGFAAIAMPRNLARNPRTPAALQRLLVRLAARLHDLGAFHHLIIAGGATASGILHEFEWTELEVVRVWGPGVVTLRPANALGFVVTVKPGSYAWPAALSREFFSVDAA